MPIHVSVPEWYKYRVTSVSISPYRDGLLIHLGGPGIAANIAFHLYEEDDEDRILHEFFPNLQEIRRRGYEHT